MGINPSVNTQMKQNQKDKLKGYGFENIREDLYEDFESERDILSRLEKERERFMQE